MLVEYELISTTTSMFGTTPCYYKRPMFALDQELDYNYEEGKIEWTSPESFIEDTDATTITFASQFVQIGKGEGILYAHVDDSFVRAYTLTEEGLRAQLTFWDYK